MPKTVGPKEQKMREDRERQVQEREKARKGDGPKRAPARKQKRASRRGG